MKAASQGPHSFRAGRTESPSWIILKNGFEIDLRSAAKQQADDFRANGHTVTIEPASGSAVPALGTAPQIKLRDGNVQVNDGSLDQVRSFPGLRDAEGVRLRKLRCVTRKGSG
jgi:hypothetical protein